MNTKQLWKEVYGFIREGKSMNKVQMTDKQRVIMNDACLSYWDKSDVLHIDDRLELYKANKRSRLS